MADSISFGAESNNWDMGQKYAPVTSFGVLRAPFHSFGTFDDFLQLQTALYKAPDVHVYVPCTSRGVFDPLQFVV